MANWKSNSPATIFNEPSVRLTVMVRLVAAAVKLPTTTEAESTLTDRLEADMDELVPSKVAEKAPRVMDGLVSVRTDPTVIVPV